MTDQHADRVPPIPESLASSVHGVRVTGNNRVTVLLYGADRDSGPIVKVVVDPATGSLSGLPGPDHSAHTRLPDNMDALIAYVVDVAFATFDADLGPGQRVTYSALNRVHALA